MKAWTSVLTNDQMVEIYANDYQNSLSRKAEERMADLAKEADRRGLRFEMTNRQQYMHPHFIGAPRFALIAK